MNQPFGLDDFFALEAGEYLDRLHALAASPTPPNGEELVRFTRALRGSALMANQPAIARAAGALEHLLRGYRDGQQEWRGDLSARTRDAVATLRQLVDRVRGWTPEDATRAERLALELESAPGPAPRPAPAAASQASDSGVRAFLAREAAALGSVLDQSAQSLGTGSASEETLTTLVRRLLPLRGLAALSDYPPLPDLLDGIERTAVSVSRLELPPRLGGQRLAAAADALVRAAREIAERGYPDPNGVEYQRFAALLLAPGPDEVPVVAVEALFFDGDDGVVKRGLPPRATLGAASVVSRGEHLVQAAVEIAQATSSAQRDLRFHVLLADLRMLPTGLPPGLDRSVETFAGAARDAIGRGAAGTEAHRFADIIREAGRRLRGYSEATQPAALAATFEPLIARLAVLGSGVAPAPAVAPPEPEPPVPLAEPEVVPIESLAPDDELAEAEPPIVPIEALAPDDEAPSARPSRAPVTAGGDGWDLAASFLQYEALLGGGVALAAAPAAAPAPPVAPVPSRQPAPEPQVVEIGALLYGGRAALERAEHIRRELRQLASRAEPMSTLQPLLDELLDLVELALAD